MRNTARARYRSRRCGLEPLADQVCYTNDQQPPQQDAGSTIGKTHLAAGGAGRGRRAERTADDGVPDLRPAADGAAGRHHG